MDTPLAVALRPEGVLRGCPWAGAGAGVGEAWSAGPCQPGGAAGSSCSLSFLRAGHGVCAGSFGVGRDALPEAVSQAVVWADRAQGGPACAPSDARARSPALLVPLVAKTQGPRLSLSGCSQGWHCQLWHCMLTLTHAHTCSHTYPHTHTPDTHAHTHTQALTHMLTYMLIHTHMLTHTRTRVYTLTHVLTHAHTHSYTVLEARECRALGPSSRMWAAAGVKPRA